MARHGLGASSAKKQANAAYKQKLISNLRKAGEKRSEAVSSRGKTESGKSAKSGAKNQANSLLRKRCCAPGWSKTA